MWGLSCGLQTPNTFDPADWFAVIVSGENVQLQILHFILLNELFTVQWKLSSPILTLAVNVAFFSQVIFVYLFWFSVKIIVFHIINKVIIWKAISFTENQNKYTNIICEKNAALTANVKIGDESFHCTVNSSLGKINCRICNWTFSPDTMTANQSAGSNVLGVWSPNSRIPLKSYNYRPQGRRSIGRPKKRWREQL